MCVIIGTIEAEKSESRDQCQIGGQKEGKVKDKGKLLKS